MIKKISAIMLAISIFVFSIYDIGYSDESILAVCFVGFAFIAGCIVSVFIGVVVLAAIFILVCRVLRIDSGFIFTKFWKTDAEKNQTPE